MARLMAFPFTARGREAKAREARPVSGAVEPAFTLVVAAKLVDFLAKLADRWVQIRDAGNVCFAPGLMETLKTRKDLQNGCTEEVPRLRAWVTTWNEDPKPFVWTKTADQILGSLGRLIQRISGAGH